MTHTYEFPVPDYRIAGFDAVTKQIEEDFTSATHTDDQFVTLTHHNADGRDSYLLLYDGSAIWGTPGTAEYVTLHIIRDVEKRTFGFNHERHPIVPLAQNWLIRRGCPNQAAELANPHGPRPADALSTRLEDLLRTNPGDRYEVLNHYTDNPCSFDSGVEVRTLVYDSHPDYAQTPYRLFLEETTKDLRSYTLREGAFATADAADAWAMERDSPLPLAPAPPGTAGRRAAAARARSTVRGNGLAVAPALVSPPRPAGPPATRPRGGTL